MLTGQTDAELRAKELVRLAEVERAARAFQGRCHCGRPGLYVIHEGLVPAGKAMWFCEGHRAMEKRK